MFEPFHCVQDLELCTSEEEGAEISDALELSTRKGVQEVFPALRSLWLVDFETWAWDTIDSFISLRKLTGRQVVMHLAMSLPCFKEFYPELM
jgi:hypothetical protein